MVQPFTKLPSLGYSPINCYNFVKKMVMTTIEMKNQVIGKIHQLNDDE
jgi:hypothetical protein